MAKNILELPSFNYVYEDIHRIFLRGVYEYTFYHSTDPRTHNGAGIVAETASGIRVVYGANHFPASVYEEYSKKISAHESVLAVNIFEKEFKNTHMIHAEPDAIEKAKSLGIPLENATLYVTDIPCGNCARKIIDSGIPRVISHKALVMKRPASKNEETINTLLSFRSAQKPVEFFLYDGKIGDVGNWYDSKMWDP